MRKAIYLLLFIFVTNIKAQNTTSKWSDLFSYNKVISLADQGEGLAATTSSGLFFYNYNSGEISKFSKPSGLHEVGISTSAYDASLQTFIIGYQSGNLDVYKPGAPVSYIVDIPLSSSVPSDKKNIQQIYASNGQALITAGYGASLFNVQKKEFGDTSLFPSTVIPQAGVISNNKAYVATGTNLYTHDLDVSFSDFNSWQIQNLPIVSLDAQDNTVVAASASTVYINTGGAFNSIASSFTNITNIKVSSGNIVVTWGNKISILSLTGTLLKTYDAQEKLNTGIINNATVYAGSQLHGVLKSTDSSLSTSLKPQGPYNNAAYWLRLSGGKIWVSTGGRNSYNLPSNTGLGYYYYDGTDWIYPSYFTQCQNPGGANCVTNDKLFNILDVIPDTSDPNSVYFTNYTVTGKQGVYKLNTQNQTVTSFINNSGGVFNFRPAGLGYAGNSLITTVGFLGNSSNAGIFLPDNNSVINSQLIGTTQRPLITDQVIWYGTPAAIGGMTAHLYNGNTSNLSNAPIRYITMDQGLPSASAISYAMDKFGDLWIGSAQGLRVLQNADQAIQSANVHVDPIIIEQNGLGEELFRNLTVLAIAVDSGNGKWVSIQDGGVFYLSPDGQQTILHFTAENSPLPNNSITDIAIDDKTGKVYFASFDGIVAYQSDVANVTDNFGNVVVYPNPVIYSQFKGNVTIKGLAARTNIRITDAAGNLVRSAVADGGSYQWDVKNFRGVRVASGIYFILMTNADGTDKKAVKVAVVN